MDAQLETILKPILDAVEEAKLKPTCRSIGELQSVLTHNIEAYGNYLQPLLSYVTSVFVQSRFDFVESLSESDFIELARQTDPSLFDEKLRDDCDHDGNPVYEGETEQPLLSEMNNTLEVRRIFVERAGIELVDITPIHTSTITIIEDTLSSLLVEHGASICDSYEAVMKEHSARAPMMFHIPRM